MDYGFPTDHTFDPKYIPPVFSSVGMGKDGCRMVPDYSREWSIEYDPEGPSQVTQSWVIPRHEQLPLAVRQMMSWNRDLYEDHFRFMDWRDTSATPTYFDRPLVPVNVRLSPLPTNTSVGFMPNHMTSVIAENLQQYPYGCQCQFPTVFADKYRMDVTWTRDEFTNRFGVKYAKVEIEPSIRLESITGASMGVVNVDKDSGEPVLTPVDNPRAVENISTGFPLREPQVLMKVTYPWVRLGGTGDPDAVIQPRSILWAGPIGAIFSKVASPGMVPNGQYLGCVNNDWFLGFPRGRVLYQSAQLVEKVSPVTGRLGYQITHDFLCLSTAEWNQVRLQKVDPNIETQVEQDLQQNTVLWPYGFAVATDKTGKVIRISMPNNQPIFPYVYKNFDSLLYYGSTTDPAPTDEA